MPCQSSGYRTPVTDSWVAFQWGSASSSGSSSTTEPSARFEPRRPQHAASEARAPARRSGACHHRELPGPRQDGWTEWVLSSFTQGQERFYVSPSMHSWWSGCSNSRSSVEMLVLWGFEPMTGGTAAQQRLIEPTMGSLKLEEWFVLKRNNVWKKTCHVYLHTVWEHNMKIWVPKDLWISSVSFFSV